jgi:hypothetical protein
MSLFASLSRDEGRLPELDEREMLCICETSSRWTWFGACPDSVRLAAFARLLPTYVHGTKAAVHRAHAGVSPLHFNCEHFELHSDTIFIYDRRTFLSRHLVHAR